MDKSQPLTLCNPAIFLHLLPRLFAEAKHVCAVKIYCTYLQSSEVLNTAVQPREFLMVIYYRSIVIFLLFCHIIVIKDIDIISKFITVNVSHRETFQKSFKGANRRREPPCEDRSHWKQSIFNILTIIWRWSWKIGQMQPVTGCFKLGCQLPAGQDVQLELSFINKRYRYKFKVKCQNFKQQRYRYRYR